MCKNKNEGTYVKYANEPEMIEFCAQCKRPTCKRGICPEYREYYDELYKNKLPYGKQYEYNGEAHTIVEWALKMGMSYNKIYHRLARGEDIAQALNDSKTRGHRQGTGKKYEYNGQEKTLCEWCIELGLPQTMVATRIYRGMTFKQAVETPVRRRRKREAP